MSGTAVPLPPSTRRPPYTGGAVPEAPTASSTTMPGHSSAGEREGVLLDVADRLGEAVPLGTPDGVPLGEGGAPVGVADGGAPSESVAVAEAVSDAEAVALAVADTEVVKKDVMVGVPESEPVALAVPEGDALTDGEPVAVRDSVGTAVPEALKPGAMDCVGEYVRLAVMERVRVVEGVGPLYAQLTLRLPLYATPVLTTTYT